MSEDQPKDTENISGIKKNSLRVKKESPDHLFARMGREGDELKEKLDEEGISPHDPRAQELLGALAEKHRIEEEVGQPFVSSEAAILWKKYHDLSPEEFSPVDEWFQGAEYPIENEGKTVNWVFMGKNSEGQYVFRDEEGEYVTGHVDYVPESPSVSGEEIEEQVSASSGVEDVDEEERNKEIMELNAPLVTESELATKEGHQSAINEPPSDIEHVSESVIEANQEKKESKIPPELLASVGALHERHAEVDELATKSRSEGLDEKEKSTLRQKVAQLRRGIFVDEKKFLEHLPEELRNLASSVDADSRAADNLQGRCAETSCLRRV